MGWTNLAWQDQQLQQWFSKGRCQLVCCSSKHLNAGCPQAPNPSATPGKPAVPPSRP